MSPTSNFKEEAENASPKSEFASIRMKNMQELAAARMAMAVTAREFNKEMSTDNNNEYKRRHTISPGKLQRERSPLMERKSSRLSGRIVNYTGLDFGDENVKGGKKWLDDDERLMAKLTPGLSRRRRSTLGTRCSTAPILEVGDVSEEMMNMISYNTTHKVYSSEHGKSCHQCRQKTVDTKSVCRSGMCIGVRGQFCGACLKDHYGEDLAEVLMDPNWSCPMCRNICNCSFCRKRAGKAPLGQVSEMARRKGYRSVHHFLMEHEGPDFIEEENEEPPTRILRKESTAEEHDKVDNEFDRKPQRSGLFIKLPFGKRKKTSIASGQQSVLNFEEEKQLQKKRKTLKTKEEMEKLVVQMEGAAPVIRGEIQSMKQKLVLELNVDWKAILLSDDESFEGFHSTDMVEYMTEACVLEARLDRIAVKNYLQHEFNKIEKLAASIEQDDVFPGF